MQLALQSLREGKLLDARAHIQDYVRNSPSDPKGRVFLFQLLAVTGEWERALRQLNVAAEMATEYQLLGHLCRPLLNAEVFRAEVFAGQRTPLVFGEPEEWVGWVVQANQMLARGEVEPAAALLRQAVEAAPAVPGTIDGQPFAWLADADSRLGPILEAMVEGRYYWIPLMRVQALSIDPPANLRDTVWLPVTFVWTNGGQAVGFVPTRYPGSESFPDGAVRLARKTDWIDKGSEIYAGVGQRMLATDADDYALMDVREIVFESSSETPDPSPTGDDVAPTDGDTDA